MIVLLRVALLALALLGGGRVAGTAVSGDITRLHAGQWQIFNDPTRFRFNVCGRGWGKSHEGLAEILRAVSTDPRARVNGQRYKALYVGPTRDQVRDIAWEWLKDSIPQELVRGKPNETNLEIRMAWGPLIRCVGADKLRARRGATNNFVVLDEFAHMREGIWAAVRPTLRRVEDRCLLITTPNGPNHAFELWNKVQGLPDWKTFINPTWSWARHDRSNLEEARQTFSRVDFDQEYGASFAALRGAVYGDFTVDRNVRAVTPAGVPVELSEDGGTVYVGQDFNAANYSAVIGQAPGEELHFSHEVHTGTSLQDHVAALQRFFEARRIDWRDGRRVVVIIDASGRVNRTSTQPWSDALLLQRAGFRVEAPPQNPHVLDRVRTVQALILSAAGRVRLYVHPRCTRLRDCFLNQVFNKWGKPDKNRGFDHFTDAAGYAAAAVYPLVIPGVNIQAC